MQKYYDTFIFRVELSKKSDPECKGAVIFQNLGNILSIDTSEHPNILESHLAPVRETQILKNYSTLKTCDM